MLEERDNWQNKQTNTWFIRWRFQDFVGCGVDGINLTEQ